MSILRRALENRWAALAGVVALGVLLRFIALDSVPLGYFHDEAWSAAKAEALAEGQVPAQIYFAENNGMDALHVYLIAFLFRLFGPLAIGSRIVSSLSGSFTILATYWAAWELFPDARRRHTIALTAAFVIAPLFAALSISRSGWHAASMTLITTLSLAALFRGRRLARRRWFSLAGLLAGLAQYTYPTARFLPVLMLLIGLIDFWTAARGAGRRAVGLNYLLLFVVAALIFAPLGAYFLQNPEWFFARAQQTTAAPLLENLVKTLAGFSIYGDIEGLHDLPGRPLLDPILSALFALGLLTCAARRRSVHAVLIAWLIVFSLPVALTGQAPLFRRWTGAQPAIAIIIALGAVQLTQWMRDRVAAPLARSLASAAIAGSLIASAGLSINAYFGPYANQPYMFWAYDSGMTQVANYIRSRPAATVFLTPYDRFYEVVAITLAEARRPPIQSYNGAACAVFPAVTVRETEWVVVTEKDDRTLPLMQRLFPAGAVVWQIDSPAGSYARALRVPAGQVAQLDLPRREGADLDGKFQLAGFDLPGRIIAGQTLPVTLALEASVPLDRAYKVFVHLRGAENIVVAQDDRLPCNFSLNQADWRPGNIVLEAYQLQVPADTPPGNYRVVLGVYQPDSGARLPVRQSDLPHDPDGIELGAVAVMR
ncbi:MAG TPA: hypothetical protein VJG32_06895 [Anaerolineae bacterium]|nr:hypothetical protein [Anaerolineae bacterium]